MIPQTYLRELHLSSTERWIFSLQVSSKLIEIRLPTYKDAGAIFLPLGWSRESPGRTFMHKIFRKLSVVTLCCALVAAQAKPLPDLKFKDLAGNPQKLDSLRGSITVISFWATWCAPCRDELPRLSQLSNKLADQDVHFVAISIDEPKDRAKVEPFLKKNNVTLNVWVGGDADMLGRLGLGEIVPGTIVLDKDGETVGRIMGEARDADITGYIDWLQHDRQGVAPPKLIKRY